MKWIFNPLMLVGAVAGLMMWHGCETLQEARHHTGPGYVTYEEPERTERVSESEYRRHKFAEGSVFLFIGIGIWVIFAKVPRDESRKKEAQERMEKALDEERRKQAKPRTNIVPSDWAGTADVEEEPMISDEQNDRTAKQVAELNEIINKIKENTPANHDGMSPDEWAYTVELLVALEQLDIWLDGGAAEVVEEEYLRSAEQKIAKASEYIATKNAEYFQQNPSLLEFQTVYRIDEQFKEYENGPSRDWSRTLKAGTKAAFPELDIVELFKIGGAFDLRRNLESLLILAYLRHAFRNRKLFLQDQDTGHEKEKRASEERADGDDIYDVTIIGGGAAVRGSAAALFEAITSAAKGLKTLLIDGGPRYG